MWGIWKLERICRVLSSWFFSTQFSVFFFSGGGQEKELQRQWLTCWIFSFLSYILVRASNCTLFSCSIGDFLWFFFPIHLFILLGIRRGNRICSPNLFSCPSQEVSQSCVSKMQIWLCNSFAWNPPVALFALFLGWSLNYFTWSVMPWSLPWSDSCLLLYIISCKSSLQHLHSRHTDLNRIQVPELTSTSPLCLCNAPFLPRTFFSLLFPANFHMLFGSHFSLPLGSLSDHSALCVYCLYCNSCVGSYCWVNLFWWHTYFQCVCMCVSQCIARGWV